MKKLLLLSLLFVPKIFGYSELESRVFDAINSRDEKWAREIIAQAEPLDRDVKKTLLEEAEKAEKFLRKATKSIEHSYGDQVLSKFAGFGIFVGSTALVGAGVASLTNTDAGLALGALGAMSFGAGVWGKYKTYYCFWAYRKLRQAQGVLGVISGAKVKEEEKKHEKHA